MNPAPNRVYFFQKKKLFSCIKEIFPYICVITLRNTKKSIMENTDKITDLLDETYAVATSLTDNVEMQVEIMNALRTFYHMGSRDTRDTFSYAFSQAQSEIPRIGFGEVRNYMNSIRAK